MKTLVICLSSLILAMAGCFKDEFKPATGQANDSSLSGSRLKSSAFAPSGYFPVWEDNFDGTSIDENNWVVASLRDPVTGDLVPGAVGDHLLNTSYAGYITSEDTYVEGGSLILRNQKRSWQGTSPAGNYNYTSSWVMSMHRIFLNKGYIEVRAKFPSGDKVWPAIWLIAEDLVWGPEWDLFEYFGYRPDVGYDDMGMHLCYGTYPNIKWISYWITPYDSRYDCETWHTYGFEWTETYAKWYIDGVEVHSITPGPKVKWPDEDMFMVLNNGQRTNSPDVTTVWPNTLEIDYIRIYKRNLLSNGGFETGNARPWGTYGTTSVIRNNQRTGSYCACIGADNSGFEYKISGLKPGTHYIFRGYVKSASNRYVNVVVKDFGGSQQVTSGNKTTYTLLSVSFTTGISNTSATVCFYKSGNGAGKSYGDDFELVPDQ